MGSDVVTKWRADKLALAFGPVLVIAGIILPASTLIEVLRTIPEPLQRQLILGAQLFKAGLVLNGLFIVSARMIDWKPARQESKCAASPAGVLPSILLTALVVTAFALRLYNLELGIWFDEIVTYVSYMDRSFGEILTTYDNQNNHLLYTLLARACFLVFDEGVWSLRFPAVLFGVASIWAVYLFSREINTWKEGLLAAGVLTFSYHHVWFSQNARGYTALLFWTMLSSWFLIRAVRDGKPGLWVAYGITTALGLFTHLSMAFIVMGHGAVFVMSAYWTQKRDPAAMWLGGFLGFAVVGLLTFQLYSLVLPQLLNWQGVGVSSWQGKVAVAPWKSPIWMAQEIFKAGNIGFGSVLLLVFAVPVFGAGLLDLARKKSPVVLLLTVPVVTSMALIMALGSTLLPRLFFFAMGFAAITLVRGLVLSAAFVTRALGFGSPRASIIELGLSACVIMASGISLARAYQPKQDYGGALSFVQNQRRPGDIVLTVDLTVLPYQRYYKVDWGKVVTAEELDTARSRGQRTWLVYTMPIVLKAAYPEIMKSIDAHFQTVKEFTGTLSGGNIVVAVAKS